MPIARQLPVCTIAVSLFLTLVDSCIFRRFRKTNVVYSIVTMEDCWLLFLLSCRGVKNKTSKDPFERRQYRTIFLLKLKILQITSNT